MKKPVPVLVVALSLLAWASDNRLPGEIAWVSGTGTGPYGANLNPDETEIWVADKGEVTGFRGRTVTVINTENPRAKETLFGAYTVDHLLLSPNGRVIRDQGGFHGGVDPYQGIVLDY